MKASEYYGDTNDRTADRDTIPQTERGTSGIVHFAQQVEALPNSRGKVLDIGCQAGHLLKRIRPRFDECYGLDIGDYSEYWKTIEGVTFMVHDVDASPLPFAGSCFDVVTCCAVLEHVFDVFGLVEEINRVLRPQGHAIIEVPNAGYIKHILNLLRGRVPRTGKHNYPFVRRDGWDGQHLHYFTIKDLSWILREFSLDPIRWTSSGRAPRVRRLWPSLLFSSIAMTAKKQPSAPRTAFSLPSAG